MRTLPVTGNNRILIVKYQGQIYAVGNNCSHYGAPLNTGMLFDNKVLCPWHGAAFDITTGALENSPGVDGIPSFKVTKKEGKYFVEIPLNFSRTASPPLSKRDPLNKTTYVIVGGGPAGLACAEGLRTCGFTGEVIVISGEDMVPYDRTLLSKRLPYTEAQKTKLRSEEYLHKGDIDFKLGKKVVAIDPKTKTITLSD